MANNLKGEAQLKALGKTWTVKLPFKLAKALKAEHGIDLMSGGVALNDLDQFEIIFTALLRASHPDITEDQVGDILTEVGLMPAAEAMKVAMARFAGMDPTKLEEAGAAPQ